MKTQRKKTILLLLIISLLCLPLVAFSDTQEIQPTGSTSDITYYDTEVSVGSTSVPPTVAGVFGLNGSNTADTVGGAFELGYTGGGGAVLVPIPNGGFKVFTYTGSIGSETYTERFYVQDNATVSGTYGTYHSASDERLKKDITTIPNALDKVQKLRGVNFYWNDPDFGEMDKMQMGLIAQEVEPVVPEAVHTNTLTGEDLGTKTHDKTYGLKAVEYEKLVGLLVQAVKEQDAEIDDLTARVSALKAKKGVN